MHTAETTQICTTGSTFSLLLPWIVTIVLAVVILALASVLLWKLRQDKRKLELEERELQAQEETVKTQNRLLDKNERSQASSASQAPAFSTGGGDSASAS